MAFLTLYLVFLTLFASVLACDLKSTAAEIAEKAALETNITSGNTAINQTYRLHYHVAPPVGWMNDPNGFSYFKGNYHLFYQYYPYNATTGPMHWGHVISKNLVDWTREPTALLPGTEQCFSGSAIEKDGTMVLMYTAHISQNGTNNETQYLAFSNDGIVFNKYKNNPVISFSPNESPDFRDPKVWKHGDYWYVILGSKDPVGTPDNETNGRVLLYRSSDMGSWEFMSVLAQSTGNLGYMWECPDFFELNGSYILLMSPQGIVPSGDRYQNLYQTGYIIGIFNYTTNQFAQTVGFQEIDYGHDFYATQTMEMNGTRYLSAWMGMWEVDHPEAADGWAGAMTIFRQLKSNGSRILMTPVDEMTSLRVLPALHNASLAPNNKIEFNKTGELIVSGNWTQNISLEIKGSNDDKLITLQWIENESKVVLDRKGVPRKGPWSPGSSGSWRIFLDASSIEVFCGEGDAVFSSRAYPNGTWVVTNTGSGDLNVTAFSLRRSVPL